MSLDIYLERAQPTEIYWANITHNLGQMAYYAGIYKYLWRPEELNITQASELINPLRDGLRRLKGNPEYYKSFNPRNGWGSYDALIEFCENYLSACEEYPDATIRISR